MFVGEKTNFGHKTRGVAAGFTLIECLVALVVIVVGFLAALMLQSKAMEGGYQATNQTAAMTLAESKIDELISLGTAYLPADLKNGGSQTEKVDANGLVLAADSEGGYERTTVLRLQCPTSQTNEVDVTVTWQDGAKSLTYTTIYQPRNFN